MPTEITPVPNAQISVLPLSRQGTPEIRKFGLFDIHVPAATRVQGHGVKTPNAAAVAAATCGFAMDIHIPNGGILTFAAVS